MRTKFKISNKVLSVLLSMALLLSYVQISAPVMVMAAENTAITYLDASGTQQTCATTTLVTAEDTQWGTANTTTWYVAEGTVTISGSVRVYGDVHLILKSGAALTVRQGVIVTNSHSFTVYGDTIDESTMGALTATGQKYYPGIGSRSSGAITLNGGIVTATGGEYGAGIGAGYETGSGDTLGTITINGGIITANGGKNGAGIGTGYRTSLTKNCNVIINGGTVNATGGAASAAVGAGFYTRNRGYSDYYINITINGGTLKCKTDSAKINNWKGSYTSVTCNLIQNNGILYDLNTKTYEIFGDVTLPESLVLSEDQTLTIKEGATVTVPSGVTLDLTNGTVTNDGTITVNSGGTLACSHSSLKYTPNGDRTHEVFCARCTMLQKTNVTCTVNDPTCTDAAVCLFCDHTYAAALGHSLQYSGENNQLKETCVRSSVCGYLETATIILDSEVSLVYTGEAIEPLIDTYSDGWQGGTCSISYSDNINAGEARGIIEKGEATATLSFRITNATMTGITANGWSGDYDGEAHSISLEGVPADATVTYKESEDDSYSAEKPAYTNAGTYTVWYQIKKANYDTVERLETVEIKPVKLTVTADDLSKFYGDSDPVLTWQITEGTTIGDDTLNLLISRETGEDVADYVITVDQEDGANLNYDITFSPGTFTITQATNEWTTPPTISGWTYGDTASTPNYEAKFGTVNVTYKGTTITGAEYPESTTPPIEAGSYIATFTVDGTTNYSGLSETKEFTVSAASIKEATVAVSDVAYTGKEQKPTVAVTLGGKTLTENTDYAVSYSDNTDIGTATVTVTGKGNYTDFASGSFKIEYLSTNAEAAVSGTEGKNDWYIGTVTLTAPAEYKISKTVNGEYADTISYDAEQNETVTYYLQNTSGEIAQKTLALKIDLTDPTAQYKITGNGWREFVNFITFGIFCKDNADLEIQAADNMSAVTVEYKISKTELTAENITDWTAYNGTVALEPQAKNYIYIKVTDDAGRTVVYESGAVVFTDCAETVNIEYFKDTDKDITAQIDLKGNTVKEIKYGGISLTNEKYTVTDDGITFAADYLDTFAASETPYSFTVSYHPMGVEMEANAEGDSPANTTISLTVKKQSGEVSNISELGKDYDGSAVSAPTYLSKSTGETTVEYKVKGTDDATYSETAPKNAGTYVVRVIVAADENYNGAYATAEFTISKVTLTVTAENKDATYGGVVPEYTVTYDGFKGNDDKKVLGGTLAFECGYAQFSDKGEYAIKASGYTSDNYIIKYVDGKLNVSAKPITVTIQNATSIYGDEIVALTATDNGIVNNDKDVYKLTTNAGKTADVGKYDIIGEALDGNYSINFENETDAYEITTRELTVSVVVANKKYDGLNTAAITSAVLNNVANNDAVALVNGTATFTTVNVADGIAISLTDFALSGEADVLKNYTLTQPTGIKANITNDWTPTTEYTVSTPNSNGWLKDDLVITAKDGYELSLTNTADGTWSDTLTYTEETADGSVTFYLKNETDSTISLAKTVTYKLDKTPANGKVEFVEKTSWQEFVNAITFGLFYNTEVTVKAEATDALSQVASIEYAVSDKAMTLDEVAAITDWTVMPESGVAVTVEDAKQFVYFVRITDKAGNETYLSTNGAEYDTTLPAISGIENGATYYTTQVVTVEDKNLASVELDGETVTLDNGTLTLAGNVDATYAIKVTDKAGNITEYTVTMKTIAELTKSLDDITVDDVTSDDKEIIEQVIEDIDEQLANDDLTEGEKTALEETKTEAQDLLDKLDEAANADDTENTEKVKDVTAETVTPENKADLEKAKEDLTKTLDDYADNLTEDEKTAIKDEIDRIDEALAVVQNVEAVEARIGDLPKTITKNDEAAIQAAEKAYNTLSDYERSLVDKNVKQALDDAKAALAELSKPTDSTTTTGGTTTTTENVPVPGDTPDTGDSGNLLLWFALLFVSGAGLFGAVIRKKKQRES